VHVATIHHFACSAFPHSSSNSTASLLVAALTIEKSPFGHRQRNIAMNWGYQWRDQVSSSGRRIAELFANAITLAFRLRPSDGCATR